MDNLEKVEL